jgi:ABC-type multidrug transport system ATPase subunit
VHGRLWRVECARHNGRQLIRLCVANAFVHFLGDVVIAVVANELAKQRDGFARGVDDGGVGANRLWRRGERQDVVMALHGQLVVGDAMLVTVAGAVRERDRGGDGDTAALLGRREDGRVELGRRKANALLERGGVGFPKEIALAIVLLERLVPGADELEHFLLRAQLELLVGGELDDDRLDVGRADVEVRALAVLDDDLEQLQGEMQRIGVFLLESLDEWLENLLHFQRIRVEHVADVEKHGVVGHLNEFTSTIFDHDFNLSNGCHFFFFFSFIQQRMTSENQRSLRFLWLTQLWALMKKHVLQKRRNRRQFALEVLFPVLFVPVLLLLIRRTPAPRDVCATCETPVQFGYRCYALGLQRQDWCYDLAYVADDATDGLVRRALLPHWQAMPTFLGLPPRLRRFANTSELDLYRANDSVRAQGVWGVAHLSGGGEPSQFAYAIQVNFFATDVLLADDKYLQAGYAELQLALLSAMINAGGTNQSSPQRLVFSAKPFPAPPNLYRRADPQLVNGVVFLLFSMFSTPTVMGLVVGIATERQLRLLESLKMMGMSERVYFLSWHLASLATSMVGILVLMIAFYAVRPLADSDVGLFVAYCVQMTLAMESFGMFVGVSFDQPRVAARGASLFLLATFGLLLAVTPLVESVDIAALTAVGLLFPVVPFGVAMRRFLDIQMSGGRVNMATLGAEPLMLWGLLMLPVQSVLYRVLVYYMRRVYPGEYGIAQRHCFCFFPSYWRNSDRAATREGNDRDALLDNFDNDNEEAGADDADDEFNVTGADAALRVTALSKRFGGSDVLALNALSAMFGMSQITALLGKNGAGKTTFLSILSGMLAPTSGDAQFLGRSVTRESTWVRTQLGVCPQHDILFPSLTAYEHLWLCATMRGVPRSTIDEDAERLFSAVGLRPADLLKDAETLSGGMKRKLAIAIAFVGNTRLVLLDEPTSGMDPHSRRELWQFLRQEQRGRCIILTTHSFDEAELLGDRVLMLAAGAARAAGTVAQLKRRFGLGYHLKIKLLRQVDIDRFVHSFVGDAQQQQQQQQQSQQQKHLLQTFVIPLERAAELARLLVELEARKAELMVESYSLYQTSLEEIFLRFDDEQEEAGGELKR